MRQLLSVLVILSLLGSTQWATAENSIINWEADDPKMQAAVSSAQDTLDKFFQHAIDENQKALPSASLKVAFAVDAPDATDELIWVSDFKHLADGRLIGKLANDPEFMRDMAYNSEVNFSPSQIVDWSFLGADQKAYGHFTTRVLLSGASKDQAQAIMEILSENKIPADW